MEHTVKTALRLAVFVVAVAATTAWLVLGFTYLNRLGWDGLLSLEPGALAATLAAVAGPPAALWLVLVVVAQQQELGLLRKAVMDLGSAIRRGQDQAEANSRALLEFTAEAGRNSVILSTPLALDDLTSQAAAVAERLGVMDADSLDLAWAKYGAGDRWAMFKPFIDRAAEESDFEERLGLAIRQDHVAHLSVEAFMRRVSTLCSRQDGVGDQKLAHDIINDGPVGRLEQLFAKATANKDGGVTGPDQTIVMSEQGLDEDTDEADSISDRLGPQPMLFPASSQSNG